MDDIKASAPGAVEPKFLLMKRGLYYRPDNCGYTGLKDHAGRYFETDTAEIEGVTAIHEDDAPDFSPACFEDLSLAHLKKKLGERDAEIAQLRGHLSKIISHLKSETSDTQPPGHHHQTPGIWDQFNGDKSGKPCQWCADWKAACAELEVLP